MIVDVARKRLKIHSENCGKTPKMGTQNLDKN
jgi:hypothetical protein